jgi:hypothetical protein
LGGYLSSKSKRRPNEDPGERRKRILRDALVMAAGAGGATALGTTAHNYLSNALPQGDVDPLTNVFTSGFGRTAAGAGIGGAATAYGNKMYRPRRAQALLRSLMEANPTHTWGQEVGPATEALERLKMLAKGPVTGEMFARMPEAQRTAASKLGIRAESLADKGISDRLFPWMQDGIAKVELGAKGLLGKIRGTNMGGKVMNSGAGSHIGEAAKWLKNVPGRGVSRFAYRHPAATAAGIAGMALPEVLNLTGKAIGPVIPNPLVRE